ADRLAEVVPERLRRPNGGARVARRLPVAHGLQHRAAGGPCQGMKYLKRSRISTTEHEMRAAGPFFRAWDLKSPRSAPKAAERERRTAWTNPFAENPRARTRARDRSRTARAGASACSGSRPASPCR